MPAVAASPAPAFKGQAVMPNGEVKEISLADYQGKNVCLFFYPLDFTYVCPSEIVAFSQAVEEFKARGVELLGCSVDSAFAHAAWRNTPLEKGGIGAINFPLMSDGTHQIAKDYGVYLQGAGIALRGLFLIDKTGTIRHMVVNDLPLGRSVAETLRMIDALQHFEQHGEVCPMNWKKGEKAMKPSSEGVASYMSTMKQ